MASSTISRPGKLRWLPWLTAALVVGAAIVFAGAWLPWAQAWLAYFNPATGDPSSRAAAEEHGHGDGNSIEVSPQARQTIGLELMQVKPQPFERTITVPGLIVERPGRSSLSVSAPVTCVVTRIHAVQGEAVEPGQPLFDLRITHEDLVQTQTEFLRTIEELDVIGREIARLEKVAVQGIAGKALLERKYEQQKQEALLRAQRQALRLHGLSETQVEGITSKRELLQNITISAPTPEEHPQASSKSPLLQVRELKVETGQSAMVGQTLAVLANHAGLHIEGSAFGQDMEAIHRAAANEWPVSAALESPEPNPEIIPNLEILYLAGSVDTDSRVFHFYVTLPNELVREDRSEGRRFIYWRYKPGQRMHIRVPVEKWQGQLVVPSAAVVQDGVESYVFVPNGAKFDRRAVHVKYRDPTWVVLANDGSVFPGETIARTGAHQLLLALKNLSGGGIDAHAGHSH
jgi:multidrug efflux pump subunit AcrA (membrane-fusion protein)